MRVAFEQHMSEGFLRRLPVSGKHSEAAGALALRTSVILRTLDAIHLAVAVESEATTMATLDNRLADAAREIGLEVIP